MKRRRSRLNALDALDALMWAEAISKVDISHGDMLADGGRNLTLDRAEGGQVSLIELA